MSTGFFDLREPWTEVRCQDDGEHCRIDVWENHGHAGTLTVSAKAKMEALATFFYDGGTCPVARVGREGKAALVVNRSPRVDCLLSEYGEIVSFAALRKECDEVVTK